MQLTRWRWAKRTEGKDADEEAPAAAPAAAPDREQVFSRDADLKQQIKEEEKKRSTWTNTLKLAYLSQGVIYGDIGTATLYAYSFVSASEPISRPESDYASAPTLPPESEDQRRENVLGVFSMMFWSLTLIAFLKYALVVIRASDSGEGGTIALYAHLCRTMGISPFGTMKQQTHQQVLAIKSAASKLERSAAMARGSPPPDVQAGPLGAVTHGSHPPLFQPMKLPFGLLVVNGQYITRFFRGSKLAQHLFLIGIMFSTGLAIADGIFMPAFTVYFPFKILVLSDDITNDVATGVTCATLILLFILQHIGTKKLSILFSPITILWLLVNAAMGIGSLVRWGGFIFRGLSPHYMVVLLTTYGNNSWALFGGVSLCIAGAETMFAAMGHFSPSSVALAFCCFVYPCLVVTYLGQGAYVLENPGEDPFWGTIPTGIVWPVWVLAMVTSLVASQAAITSTFALIRQATTLAIFPKLKIIHTDQSMESRIFIPLVNYVLMICCVIVVAITGSWSDTDQFLATSYAVSVVSVMLSTTFILLLTGLVSSNLSLLIIVPAFLLCGLLEGLYLAGALYNMPTGAWSPLLIAFIITCIMFVWWSGSYQRRKALMRSSKGFNSSLIRVDPGTPAQQHPQLFSSVSSLTPAFSGYTFQHLGSLGRQSEVEAYSDVGRGGGGRPSPRCGAQSMKRERSSAEPNGSVPLRSTSTGLAITPDKEQAASAASYLAMMGRPDQSLARASGLGLYYGETPLGMPLVMRHFLKNVDAIHEVCIILIVRFLPMPIVRSTERLLVRPVKSMPNFYQVVVRYGYQDKVDHGDSFVSKLISTIMFKLEIKAGLKYQTRQEDFIAELEGDAVEEGNEEEGANAHAVRQEDTANRVFNLPIIQESYLGEEEKVQEEMAKWEAEQTYSPFISRYALECLSRIRMVASAPDASQAAKDAFAAAQALLDMASAQVVHYRARTFTRQGNATGTLHKLYNNSIGVMYSMMESLSYSDSQAWRLPIESTVELGIAVEI